MQYTPAVAPVAPALAAAFATIPDPRGTGSRWSLSSTSLLLRFLPIIAPNSPLPSGARPNRPPSSVPSALCVG